MPKSDSDSREITPRNMVWVEDMPPGFRGEDYNNLTVSHYTHAIICFFHLGKDSEQNLKLYYNDINLERDWPYNNTWWNYLHTLKINDLQKTLMLSVGGWNSGTWENAKGQEKAGAEMIVKFAEKEGFAGIDFNFEGSYDFRDDRLWTFAKMVVEVRKRWPGLFTITPMRFEVTSQLWYVEQVAGSSFPLSDLLSWIKGPRINNLANFTFGEARWNNSILHETRLVLI